MKRLLVCGLLLLAALGTPAGALARGGDYVLDGGTDAQQEQVRAALDASSFDWDLVGARVTIHVRPGVASHATPGHVWLDADLLDAGRFAWAVVQDEYAHQVDFFRFDDVTRSRLLRALGGSDWCYAVTGLGHGAYACERFASTLVWAYWQSPDNAYRPSGHADESAAMEPAAFRRLMNTLLGAPLTVRSVRRSR